MSKQKLMLSDCSVEIRRQVPIVTQFALADFVTFNNLPDNKEHIALLFGDWSAGIPVVRMHSECLTGDVFGSSHCDCGQQLEESIKMLSEQGGVLLYLRQEGRGIGLYNKLDAYALQQMGYDTFEANRLLGHPSDKRDYECAGVMLNALGLAKIQLITNNPDKATQLRQYGVEICSIIRTGVFLTPENKPYLEAKVKFSNHTIKIEGKND